MDAKTAIRINLDMGQLISLGYLDDLSDQEMMHRPAPAANHIKWQIGHLVANEHGMLEACLPGSMPPLPAGFAEKYTKESASSDNPNDFHSKAELLEEYKRQRTALERQLANLDDSDLDAAAPESMRSYAPTLGAVFSMQGTHWMMHAGQWAVIRRQLGRAPQF